MKRAVALVLIAGLLTGCGYRLAGSGSLPSGWKRVGIPTFVNKSPIPELDRLVSEAIREELGKRARVLVVQDTTGVDAVLTGTIVSVDSIQQGVTADALASRYVISVVISAEMREVKDNSVYWKDPSLRVGDQYEATTGSATTDIATLFTGNRNALERIATKIAEGVVSAILTNIK